MFVAFATGVLTDSRSLKAFFYGAGIIAVLPASACYFLIRRGALTIDKWRLRHGQDVYLERKYEDDGGYIHLNELPACEQEQEISVREIVSGLGEMSESKDLTKDLK